MTLEIPTEFEIDALTLSAFFMTNDILKACSLNLAIEEETLLRMPPQKRNQHTPQVSNSPERYGCAPQKDLPVFAAFGFVPAFGFAAVMMLVSPALANDAATPLKAYKSTMAAHLHAAPASQSPVVASVPINAALTSSQPCTKGWCLVEYKGIRGWIYKNYVAETPVKAAPAAAVPAKPAAKAAPPQPLPVAAPQPAAAPPPARAAAPRSAASAAYRVIGLQPEESLPMREGPLDSEPMVASLSSSASGITDLRTCVRQWCLIGHDGIKGYAQSRFLAHERLGPTLRYSIAGETNLKVFSYRAADADVVGEIPFYASGILAVGDCSGDWCHVRYLGLVGFVETRSLRHDPTPEG